MSDITLAEAQEQLAHWLTASKEASKAQAFTSTRGGVRNSREMSSPAEIRKQISFWRKEVQRLSGYSRVIGVAP